MTISTKTAVRLFEQAECLYDNHAVQQALDTLGVAITARLKNENPLVIAVLKGGMVALGHLVTRLHFPLEIDYIHATRYQGKTTGANTLEFKAHPTQPLQGRTLLIVDDILDRGITLSAIIQYCLSQQAKAVYTAVLADKPTARVAEGLPQADFAGLTLPDRYVVGYGLDCHEYWRNAPGIYAIPEEDKIN